MSATFETAIQAVLRHEGGFVDHPDDPGGETKYGISKRQYPDVDIAALTLEAATAIYRRDYWTPLGLNHVDSQAVATKCLDLAVNLGVRQAALLLQRALTAAGESVIVDGVVGPNTLRAVNHIAPPDLVAHLRVVAVRFYLDLWAAKPAQRTAFARGWLTRAIS